MTRASQAWFVPHPTARLSSGARVRRVLAGVGQAHRRPGGDGGSLLSRDGAERRLQLAQRYSYVLPEPRLLDVLCRHSPLVEVGAGTGYWAHRLRLAGADVLAYDQTPLGGARRNRYHPDAQPWTEVLEGDATVLRAHPQRAFFLCWPPAYSSLWEALRFYAGEVVVYVGDWGPRTARLAGLEDAFRQLERHPAIPLDPAPGRPAELSVWRRRRPGST